MTKQQQRKKQSNSNRNQTVANQINQSSSTISGITSPSFPNNSSNTSQSVGTSLYQNNSDGNRDLFTDICVDSLDLPICRRLKQNSLIGATSGNRQSGQQVKNPRRQVKKSTSNSSMKATAGSHTSGFQSQILSLNNRQSNSQQINNLKKLKNEMIAENLAELLVKKIQTRSDAIDVSNEELYRKLLLNKSKQKDSPQKTTKNKQQKK